MQYKKISDHDNIIAVYSRTKKAQNIPVIVLKDDTKIDAKLQKLCHDEAIDGIIILTEEDIRQGDDAFALTYLFMKQTTSYEGGKHDILQDIDIKPKYVRLHIETLARQMLIDAREHIILEHNIDQYRDYIVRADDRIGVGYKFLGYKYTSFANVTDRQTLVQKLLDIVEHIDTIA